MLKYFLIAAAAAIVLAVFTAYICYRRVFAVTQKPAFDPFELPAGEQYEPHHPKMRELIEKALALPGEDIYIKSFDGTKLHAKYYENEKGAPVQILFHGYQSNPYRDLSGGLPLALKSGCSVILVDQRAHGKSGGKCLSFGILERKDAAAWAEYAAKKFNTPIILTGISMGGATALMASELELPQNVKGIISDCAYSSPKAIICSVMKKAHYPVKLVYPFVKLGAKLFGGFNMEEADAVTAVKNTKLPILLLHGEDDRFVPCEMSREIYKNCNKENTEIYTFSNAGHGLSYTMDPKKYESATKEFIARCIK